MSREKYLPLVQQAAQQHGVPPAVLAGLIEAESNWNPNAKNPNSSAHGLGQFVKGTAKEMGVNTADPASSIDGAARYLKQLHTQFGDWNLAVQGYHDGAGALNARLKGGKAAQSRESSEYLGRVMGAAKQYGDVPAASVGGSGRALPPSLLEPVQLAKQDTQDPAQQDQPLEPQTGVPEPVPLQRPPRQGHQLAALVEGALGGTLKTSGMPPGLGRLIDRLIDA